MFVVTATIKSGIVVPGAGSATECRNLAKRLVGQMSGVKVVRATEELLAQNERWNDWASDVEAE